MAPTFRRTSQKIVCFGVYSLSIVLTIHHSVTAARLSPFGAVFAVLRTESGPKTIRKALSSNVCAASTVIFISSSLISAFQMTAEGLLRNAFASNFSSLLGARVVLTFLMMVFSFVLTGQRPKSAKLALLTAAR
jgi:hypothetical protein